MQPLDSSCVIRPARLTDAEALLSIYAPCIANTAITFEYDIPSLDDFRARIERISAHYPYLVAERNGQVIGYAYAAPLKERKACEISVEMSIYLSAEHMGHGVGRRLYGELEEILRHQGIRNLYASIAFAPNDDYVDDSSIRFHERMGYSLCGTMHACAHKFGHIYDLVWMEKFLSLA